MQATVLKGRRPSRRCRGNNNKNKIPQNNSTFQKENVHKNDPVHLQKAEVAAKSMQSAAAAAADGCGSKATVEDYLTAYTEHLIACLQARTESQIEHFRSEFERRKEIASGTSGCTGRRVEHVPFNVHLSCVDGPYKGRSWKLKPRLDGKPVLLGRSTGKKFTRGGVSLSKDDEVSTTHGSITISKVLGFSSNNKEDLSNDEDCNGVTSQSQTSCSNNLTLSEKDEEISPSPSTQKGRNGIINGEWHGVTFTDLGSSNGSYLNNSDESLIEDDPVFLQNNDRLRMGQTVFEVKLVKVE